MLQRRVVTAATLEGAQRITPSLIGAESSDTTTINVPTGAQAGDFALLFGYRPDLRSGWTQTYNQTGAEPYFEAHYVFLPDPVPSSYTFTNMRLGILMVFRSVDSSNPLDASVPTLATTNTSPAVTTNNSRSMVVLGFAAEDASSNIGGASGSNVPGAPTGYNLAKTQGKLTTSPFRYTWFAAAYRPIITAAAVTPTAWQDTDTGSAYSAANMAAGTIALRGAPI